MTEQLSLLKVTVHVRQGTERRLSHLRVVCGDRCYACGSVMNLEFAHLRATGLCGRGRGQIARYYDIAHNPECYTLLCRPCHLDLDTGRLDRTALPSVATFIQFVFTFKRGKSQSRVSRVEWADEETYQRWEEEEAYAN